MTNYEFNEYMRRRMHAFTVNLLKFCSAIPLTTASRVMNTQICRSGTSITTNYRAFCRGRSHKERYAKICIVVEEADETICWLELLRDMQYAKAEEIQPLIQECEEILKIVAKTKSSHEKWRKDKKENDPENER